MYLRPYFRSDQSPLHNKSPKQMSIPIQMPIQFLSTNRILLTNSQIQPLSSKQKPQSPQPPNHNHNYKKMTENTIRINVIVRDDHKIKISIVAHRTPPSIYRKNNNRQNQKKYLTRSPIIIWSRSINKSHLR